MSGLGHFKRDLKIGSKAKPSSTVCKRDTPEMHESAKQ